MERNVVYTMYTGDLWDRIYYDMGNSIVLRCVLVFYFNNDDNIIRTPTLLVISYLVMRNDLE